MKAQYKYYKYEESDGTHTIYRTDGDEWWAVIDIHDMPMCKLPTDDGQWKAIFISTKHIKSLVELTEKEVFMELL